MIPYGGASGGPNISDESFKKLFRWTFGLVAVGLIIGGVVTWEIGPVLGAIPCIILSYIGKFMGPA